jgi:hypothetical protein
LTAATAKALMIPTPMNAATRAIPDVTTMAKRCRQGLMMFMSVPTAAPHPT